jgi:hypothetical protein
MPSANTHAETILLRITHLTTIVTTGLDCPATPIATGTASPVVVPAGVRFP